MRKDKGDGGRSIWINNFKTLYVKEVKELCLSVKDRGCHQVPRLPRKVPRKVVCERLCVTKLYVTKLYVTKLFVCDKVVCNELVCGRVVTKLCVCDKIVCERVCVMKLCVEE